MSQETHEWKVGELCLWVNNEYDTVKLYELAQHRMVKLLNDGMHRHDVAKLIARPIRKVVDISAERIPGHRFSVKVREDAVKELIEDTLANYDHGYYEEQEA